MLKRRVENEQNESMERYITKYLIHRGMDVHIQQYIRKYCPGYWTELRRKYEECREQDKSEGDKEWKLN